MAFKLNATNGSNKQYLWQATYCGNGMKLWYYVSADAPATVDGSGYIDGATNGGDHQVAADMLSVGDTVRVYQVASISDDRSIQDDMKSGITDVSEHLVLDIENGVVDLSDDLVDRGPVTYGD